MRGLWPHLLLVPPPHTQGWSPGAQHCCSPWRTCCRLLPGCSPQSASRSCSGTSASSASLLPARSLLQSGTPPTVAKGT